MTTKYTTRIVQLLATGFLLACTGCETVEKYSLTHRLWHSGDWQQFSEPAPNPNLALFEATNRSDLLIQYDALSEKSSTPRRRAYFLNPNERRIATGKKPKWVNLSVTNRMDPIPVLATPTVDTNRPPQMPAYAVPSKGGRAFTLHGLMKSETTFDLPVYTESSGTPVRVILTPLAVAGDTVLVTAASAAVGFMLWIHCGAPTH